ncbi:MAG: peptide chain release factor N(5)-glutamine methyltransferase [Streptosporangiales bacterium]|nr:peptide chain release factor N(5)-glutamine methyltransferase [Streptosporangiales bacterium]MBO0891716.1 peptide chain release factor N(5)-glutamine methyltransferase [Acidothermales bacterium]
MTPPALHDRGRVRDAVAEAACRLAAAGVDSAGADAAVLAAHVLGVPRDRLALAGGFDDAQARAYADLVGRRAGREPLQHITGVAYFRHLALAVGPGVFVPRPETELLVDHVLAEVAARPGRSLLVDLCTGSGAIAVAAATETPGVEAHAVELDAAAYAWARRNVEGTGVRLHLGEAADCLPGLDGRVDVVVANPPYVPAGTPLPAEVGADPACALYAGADGLDGVRTVAAAAGRLLRPGGLLVCEHDDSHGESAPALLSDLEGWTGIRDHRDLAGRPRFVTARRS